MSEQYLTDVLGPIEEWLISPDEIEQACAGLCEHQLAVWDCWPCLTVRIKTRQGQKIGARMGMNDLETDELVACFVSADPTVTLPAGRRIP